MRYMKANDEALSNLGPTSTDKANKNEEHESLDLIDKSTPMTDIDVPDTKVVQGAIRNLSFNIPLPTCILTLSIFLSYRRPSIQLGTSADVTRTVYANQTNGQGCHSCTPHVHDLRTVTSDSRMYAEARMVRKVLQKERYRCLSSVNDIRFIH